MLVKLASCFLFRPYLFGLAVLMAGSVSASICARVVQLGYKAPESGQRIRQELTREDINRDFATALRLTELANATVVLSGAKQQEMPILTLLESQLAAKSFDSIILVSQTLWAP